MREGWQSFLKMIRYYPRVLRLVWEASPRYTVLAFMLAITSAAVLPVQIWISKVLIDRVADALQASTPSVALDWIPMLTPIVLIFLVWVVGGVSQSMEEGIRDLLMLQVGNHAEYVLLQKASALDIAFFENPTFYDQMEIAQREIARARGFAFLSVDFAGALLSLGGVAALLIRLHPLAVVVLLLTAAPQVAVQVYYSSQLYGLYSSRTSARRMVKYLSGLLGSRDEVKEMRLFELHTPFLERHRHFWQMFVNEIKGIRFARERVNALLSLLSMGGTAAIWVYTVMQAALARITIGDMALVFQAAQQSQYALRRLFMLMGFFYENSLFTSNFFDFLDLAPDSVEGALARDGHESGAPLPMPTPVQTGIEFRDVSFHYPGSDRLVLQNLSFVISPEETVALVGENGAGKTTLVKLLARLYDPTEGQILLDGTDLREYDLDDLRRQVGVIFQDFVRFDLTARENIGFGQVEFVEDLERVAEAADRGSARPIVDRLAEGFDTMLGRTFDGGVDLSGGEWQKLALSRAFMREAQILILDEPTAALDALAEYEVYKRFADLTSGKTAVLISHRFSTVRMADHIIVLKEGRLTEEGDHDELMALDGLYARMFKTQAERYR